MPPRSGNQRAKTIDYDDDDAYSDEDYYGEEGEGDGMTDEDKEQLRLGTIQVKEQLGSGVSVTDKEVQEALWHYYYDVAKSVSYLKNKHAPKQQSQSKQQKAPSKFDQAAGAASAKQTPGKQNPSSLQHPLCPESSQCQEMCTFPKYHAGLRESLLEKHTSANTGDFFWDMPWGNVPSHRLATFTVEPLYRGGLLGGSKLAALAAKRKQKQEDAQKAEGAKGEPDKAVALLDRLSIKNEGSSSPSTREGEPRKAFSRYPKKPSPSPAPVEAEEEKPEEPEPTKPVIEFPDLRATPSTFASTLCGPTTSESTNLNHISSVPLPYTASKTFGTAAANSDPFASPSPDDIVRRAQARSAGHLIVKPKTTSKKKDSEKLAESVEKLTVVDDTPKVKSKNLNVVEEFEKSGMKRIANFVVIGHVDHGKSTLMGRLLYDLKVIDQRSVDKLRKEAETIGKSSFALAWVMDQTSEERSRGVTVDVAMEHFQTDKTRFTILDAPGHRDFVPRMISGASQADFAVLVIDSNANGFESGLKGQTKEHALVVRSMGVQRIIVAVNKMDSVQWSKERFDEVCKQMMAFFTSASFLEKNITFIPCAGLTGDNVTKRVEDPSADWYKGKTLIEALDSYEPAKRDLDQPLRLAVADVFRGGITAPISISGRIDSGTLQVGDTILALPSHETASVRAIEVEQEPVDWAVAGQIPTLHLTDIDPIHLRLGDIICDPKRPVRLIKEFSCRILSFEHLLPSAVDVFRSQLWAAGKVTKLKAVLNKFTGEVVRNKVRMIKPGEVARVVVELEREMPLEEGTRVVLRSGGRTVAAGLLES